MPLDHTAKVRIKIVLLKGWKGHRGSDKQQSLWRQNVRMNLFHRLEPMSNEAGETTNKVL